MGVALPKRAQYRRTDRTVGQIFANAILLRIVDPHDDERRNFLLADQSIGSLIHLPFNSAKSRGGIEKILAVVQIKNGIVALAIGLSVIFRRQPDPQHSLVAKNAALKFMQPQIAYH